jgi:hypothetical protein
MAASSSPRRRYVLALVLVIAGTASHAFAQDVTEVRLKGAFLLNFARFTEWPSDALRSDSAVTACVLGDRGVGDVLAGTVKGKSLAGHAITVNILAPDVPIPTCHLLYLSGVGEKRTSEIVSTLRDVPVLTVSDSDAFTKRGGIIQIFVDSGKMKFRINARSAKRARLQLSSRLLALAEVVDEDAASIAAVPPVDVITSTSSKPAAPDIGDSTNTRAPRTTDGRGN